MEEGVDWDGDSLEDVDGHREGDGKNPEQRDEAKEHEGKKRKREASPGVVKDEEQGPSRSSGADGAPSGAIEQKSVAENETVLRAVKFLEKTPERVKEAARKSKDLGEYKRNRKFTFIHLFSGPVDNLAKALIEGAKRAGIEVMVRSLDIKLNVDDNLKEADKWKKLKEEVDDGDFVRWIAWRISLRQFLTCSVARSSRVSTSCAVVRAPLWFANKFAATTEGS